MSKAQSRLTLNLSSSATLAVCRAAVASLGWRITGQSASILVCEEASRPLISFTNPVRAEIVLAGEELGPTRITMNGSNLGFGPIQSNHVKKQLGALEGMIARLAADPSIVGRARQPEATGVQPSLSRSSADSHVGGDELAQPPPQTELSVWDWIKDAAKQVMQTGAGYLQHRTFILSLFSMPPHQANWALKQRIEQMSESDMQIFSMTVAGMIGEAEQAAQQASSGSSSGGTFEDQTAQFMAEARSGFPSSQSANQARTHLQGLYTVAFYADQFHQEKLARTEQASGFESDSQHVTTPQLSAIPQNVESPAVSVGQTPASAPSDTGKLERMLEELVNTGQLDPTMLEQLLALNDGASMDRILTKLKELGADEGPSPPLNIADYYPAGSRKYQLKWPLSQALQLPMPFEELDRETQFHVLFAEWSRRELEGNQALHTGDTSGAQVVFEECLARAEQLGVAELRARSYEGMMRVAQRLGDSDAEGKWLDAALAVRENE